VREVVICHLRKRMRECGLTLRESVGNLPRRARQPVELIVRRRPASVCRAMRYLCATRFISHEPSAFTRPPARVWKLPAIRSPVTLPVNVVVTAHSQSGAT
jgi:hypothetical protein